MDIEEFLRQSAYELGRDTYSDTPGHGVSSEVDRINNLRQRNVDPNIDKVTPQQNQGQIYALERLARMHPQERQSLLDFMYRQRLNQMDKSLGADREGWGVWPLLQQMQQNKRTDTAPMEKNYWPREQWNSVVPGFGWRM